MISTVIIPFPSFRWPNNMEYHLLKRPPKLEWELTMPSIHWFVRSVKTKKEGRKTGSTINLAPVGGSNVDCCKLCVRVSYAALLFYILYYLSVRIKSITFEHLSMIAQQHSCCVEKGVAQNINCQQF